LAAAARAVDQRLRDRLRLVVVRFREEVLFFEPFPVIALVSVRTAFLAPLVAVFPALFTFLVTPLIIPLERLVVAIRQVLSR
jgi:hypothetical protein